MLAALVFTTCLSVKKHAACSGGNPLSASSVGQSYSQVLSSSIAMASKLLAAESVQPRTCTIRDAEDSLFIGSRSSHNPISTQAINSLTAPVRPKPSLSPQNAICCTYCSKQFSVLSHAAHSAGHFTSAKPGIPVVAEHAPAPLADVFPGGHCIQATAPATAEYVPGWQRIQSECWFRSWSRLPGAQGVQRSAGCAPGAENVPTSQVSTH